MKDNTNYPIVEKFDNEFFKKYASYEFVDRNKLSTKKGLFEAAYVGFGFLCIKRGVFEAMEYPYFSPVKMVLSETLQDYASEDVSWCINITKLGYKIYVDPEVKVGHQKLLTLI